MNIESIDEQHRIQTEYILHLNNLLDAEKTRASDPELIQQIIEETKKIHRFAARHFEHEEEIMEKLEAPNQSTHISEHKEILRKIQNYIDNVTSGKIMVSMKLKILLAEWWINHINYTDFKSFRESRPSLIFHVEPGDPT